MDRELLGGFTCRDGNGDAEKSRGEMDSDNRLEHVVGVSAPLTTLTVSPLPLPLTVYGKVSRQARHIPGCKYDDTNPSRTADGSRFSSATQNATIAMPSQKAHPNRQLQHGDCSGAPANWPTSSGPRWPHAVYFDVIMRCITIQGTTYAGRESREERISV